MVADNEFVDSFDDSVATNSFDNSVENPAIDIVLVPRTVFENLARCRKRFAIHGLPALRLQPIEKNSRNAYS